MTSARWILGLGTLLLAGTAHGQQCPPAYGALNPGLLVHVSSLPAQPSAGNIGGSVGGATVCILEATPAGPDYSIFAYNITLLPGTSSVASGHACINFDGPARAVGMRRDRFRGTLVVRAHKDGYCAGQKTLDFAEGSVMGHLLLKEISPASTERAWCGSLAGMRCSGTGAPSPFREPVPQAAPELLQQAPTADMLTPGSPGTPVPMDSQPHDTLTQPAQHR